MRRIFFFSVIILLSCQESSTEQVTGSNFDLPGFTQLLIANMDSRQADVAKTFVLNEDMETRDFKATDSLFWSKELDWLRRTDLNSPKFKGVLTVLRGEKDTNSNLLLDRYISSSEDTELREIEIYYLDELSEIRLIKLNLGTRNFIADSKGQMTIWLNKYNDLLLIDSLITIGKDKVLFQQERNYRSSIERVRQ